MLIFIVGKVIGIGSVAHDKQLHIAKQRVAVTITGFIFIINDLLHSLTGRDAYVFQFNLHNRQPIDQQNNVIPLMAVFCIDA